MSNIIIYDFEVFKYDTLLGAIIINDDECFILQTWNLDEIRNFYKKNINSIWIGHNNSGYDNFILESIIKKKNPYDTSQELIHSTNRFQKLTLHLYYYDIMSRHFGSLKAIEGSEGKKISESEISFNIDRRLLDKEKIEVESYNLDDLNQTYDNFISTIDEFNLKLDIAKEFNLSLDVLNMTSTQIAEKVLGAKQIKGIETQYVAPKMYDNLQVKNQELIDFYLNEEFRNGKNIEIMLCGVEHKIGSGGIHGAKKKYHCDFAYYFDVSGYYNLIMILLNLLPRTIPKEGKKLYEYMYHEQLKLKKTNPRKRAIYKEILLAVFGATLNEYCGFYDPNHGTLITMVGQMYAVDLIEKLEGKFDLIQSNTDGIIAAPLPGVTEEDAINIINEWQERTGFVLKLEKVYNIHQRDVNNYMFVEGSGKVHVIGEAVKYYNTWENVLLKNCFYSKEPLITHQAIVEFFVNNKLPEQVIEENKNKLRLFQYICKKGSYDYCVYEITNLETNEITQEKVQNINRVFASNSELELGMIYKIKTNSKAKISNLPDNIFIYNEEILSKKAVNKLIDKIDYSYYIKRSYERIAEFIDISYIKDLNI